MIFTHELKTDKADKLAKEVERFLNAGGEIKQYDNFGNMKQYEVRKPSQCFNRKAQLERAERLKVQKPLLEKYAAAVGFTDRWKRLIDASGADIAEHTLWSAWKGRSTIKCPDTWKKLAKAMNKIIAASDCEVEAVSKEERLAYQQPILKHFYDNYESKRIWKDLAEKAGNVVTSQRLGDTYAGRTTVGSHEDFKKVELAIAELLK